MGFSKGSVAEAAVSNGNGSFPLYTGIAPVHVVAVNPTAEQLSAIYGRPVEKIADYTGTNQDGVKYVRLDFILKVSDTLLEHEKIEEPVFGKLTFFLTTGVMHNLDKTKFKIINDYGQTQWVTEEIFKAKGYPVNNNGEEMKDFLLPYKPCIQGEEELIQFLRCYLNIPNFREQVDGVYQTVSVEKLKDCQSAFTLEEISKMLNGDISPVENAISYQPNNQVRVLFTVKVTTENKKYQHIYNRMFAKAKDYNWKERLEKFIKANESSVNNLEFNYAFGEWKETPSELPTTTPKASENPFDLPF